MIDSQTHFGEGSKTANRRAHVRQPLNWVVLVYFGESNWGKLQNLNETGMCFEYAEPPKQGQRIRFTLEGMGRLPAPLESEVLSEKLLAAGEIKWIRDFERTAGVQFTELSDESKDLIDLWFSYKSSLCNETLRNEISQRVVAPLPQSHLPKAMELFNPAPVEKLAQSGAVTEWEEGRLSVEPVGTLEPQLVERILEAPTYEAYSQVMAEEKQKREPQSAAKKWLTGTGPLVALTCLGIFVATAGLRMILPLSTHKSEAAERPADRMAVQRPLVNAKYSSHVREAKPFLVEVQDAENRRWLLWFDRNSAETVSVAATPEAAAANSHKSVRAESVPIKQGPSPKAVPRHNFPLVTPKVNRTKTSAVSEASLSSVPVLPHDAPPLDAALNGILGRSAKPEPAVETLPTGGDVRPARLIKAVPPAYPALARANRVTGDVTLDALIDASGKVTDVKVVAGHNLLREAAIEALRSWKYEPARLGGRPVPMRLSVTVKFHFE